MLEKQHAVIVGDYLTGGGFGWAYWPKHHAKLALIGSNENGSKRQFLKGFSNLLSTKCEVSVHWITGEDPEKADESITYNSIPWVEGFSDPPEFFDDRHTFMDIRSFFTSSYVRLLAMKRGINRAELPALVYREHMEGPLAGFRRVVNQNGLTWLEEELRELDEVHWCREGNVRKFYVTRNLSIVDNALSFLKAVWSVWAHIAQMKEPEQFLIIAEPPRGLLSETTNEQVRDVVVKALSILNYLADETTTTFVLSSEMLYPVPELPFRHLVILPTSDSDINLMEGSNRENIQAPSLFAEWDRGNHRVCLWEDRYTGERHIIQLRTTDQELVEIT